MKISSIFSGIRLEALFLSLVLFFQNAPRLVFSSLNMDEILSWQWASGSWGDLFRGVYNDTQQILYYALLKIFMLMAPAESDLWVRIPSLLLGSFAVCGIYQYVRRNYSLPTALFFIVGSITHPLIAYVSTYNRPYALLFFLTAWHLFLAHRLLIQSKAASNGVKWLLVFGTVAIPFAHYLGLFYLFSVFCAVLMTVGMKPIAQLFKSSAKRVFVLSMFAVVGVCLAYQYQFRERISWALGGDVNFFRSVFTSSGFSGILLVTFFVDLKNFRQRSVTEKFLSAGLVVGLSLMIVSRMWTPVYMIILTPYFLWLAALYFEKIFMSVRTKDFFKSYALSIALAALVFINPYFIQRITPEFKVFMATNAFLKVFRTGNWDGIKNLLEHLKENRLIQENTKVLCIRPEWLLIDKPIELYSKMYFGKDICTEYLTNVDHKVEVTKYDYVIYVQKKDIETSKESFQLSPDFYSHLTSILKSDDYELFRTN